MELVETTVFDLVVPSKSAKLLGGSVVSVGSGLVALELGAKEELVG